VRSERDAAADVSVVGWHHAEGDARLALVRYLDARVAYLRAVASDPDILYVQHPELQRLLASVRAAFRGIAAQRRVDAAFSIRP
jgi:hypothetical protein